MALSMDEQRALAEIERRLAAEDPGLASCMTNFKRPGPAAVLRSPRARILGSVFTVLLVGMISLMVYAMIPLRGHSAKTPGQRSATTTAMIPSQLSPGSTNGPAPTSSGAATVPSKQVSANAATRTSTIASATARTHADGSTTPAAPPSHAASGAPATASTHHTRAHGSYP